MNEESFQLLATLTDGLDPTGSAVLIGTWADAVRAIRFYRNHGFRPDGREEKDQLLKRYWKVPDRQKRRSSWWMRAGGERIGLSGSHEKGKADSGLWSID